MGVKSNRSVLFYFVWYFVYLAYAVVYWPPNEDMIKTLKGFDLNYTYPWMYSGFVEVDQQTDSHLFYWFFREENGNTSAPLVLWINGGPGSSSMIGNLLENGPLKLVEDIDNDSIHVHSLKGEAWTSIANVVYVDQPIGTGYSYGHKNITDGKQIGDFIIKFLNKFYQKFPDMKSNNFYISGESYAGKYLPAIATSIIDFNKNMSSADKINLKGVLIGNEIADPMVQFPSIRHLSLSIGHIQIDSLPELDTVEQRWQIMNGKHAANTFDYWFGISNYITDMNGGMDIYDSRYHESNQTKGENLLERYLNDPEVIYQLHCDKSQKSTKFISWNSTVSKNFNSDKMIIYTDQHQAILDNNITLWIFVGQFDSLLGSYGIQAWMKTFKWKEMGNFFSSSRNLYYYVSDDNKKIKLGGNFKQYKNLSLLIVYSAGHLVPTTQLALSKSMLSDIMFNDGLVWHQEQGNWSLDVKTWDLMNNWTDKGEWINGKCRCNDGYFGADCSITVDSLYSNSFILNSTSWKYFKIEGDSSVQIQIKGSNFTTVYTRKGDIPSQSLFNSYFYGNDIKLLLNKNTTGEYIAIFNSYLDSFLGNL